jgi:hypothetical protein
MQFLQLLNQQAKIGHHQNLPFSILNTVQANHLQCLVVLNKQTLDLLPTNGRQVTLCLQQVEQKVFHRQEVIPAVTREVSPQKNITIC